MIRMCDNESRKEMLDKREMEQKWRCCAGCNVHIIPAGILTTGASAFIILHRTPTIYNLVLEIS